MSTFLLIRHGDTDWLGKGIAGRKPEVMLNAVGLDQAQRLASYLRGQRIDRIFCSPLERTQQTAAPLAQERNLDVQSANAIQEIDFGQWTGQSFNELNSSRTWSLFNSNRSITRIPDGEHIQEVQTRFVTFMQQLHERHPDDVIALFSHGDPIRTAVGYFAGIPIDLLQRIEIAPASISAIELSPYSPRLLHINTIPR